jgi:hypothetical protein
MLSRATWMALLSAALAFALTLFYYHWTVDAAQVAARNTARFSALWMAAAIAWRASERGLDALKGFVATHAVHYAAVLWFAYSDAHHHLHSFAPTALLVATFGTAHLIVVATTMHAATGWRQKLNSAAVYLAWLLFVIATGSRLFKEPAAAVVFAVMLAAMAYRLLSASKPMSMQQGGAQ